MNLYYFMYCILITPLSLSAYQWTESPEPLVAIINNSHAYNKNVAPGQINNTETIVNVALYIESLSSFKAQTMDFEVDMYLMTGWFDRRLSHNRPNPILISDLDTANMMWKPDLYFVNSKKASFQHVTTPNFLVVVYSDGYVFKSMRVNVKVSCMMDLTLFPFDEHTCRIVMQSYAYVSPVVQLQWFEKADSGFPISFNEDIILNDMIIKEPHQFVNKTAPYPLFRGHGQWTCIIGFLRMKRMLIFHLLQTYIPTTMLVCISWLSFWLDIRAAPARISLTITTLLTLVSVGNGARTDLPQVSYIKAIDIWLTTCTAFVFAVLMEYTIVNFYTSREVSRTTKKCPHDYFGFRRTVVDKLGNTFRDLSSNFRRGSPTAAPPVLFGDESPTFGRNPYKFLLSRQNKDTAELRDTYDLYSSEGSQLNGIHHERTSRPITTQMDPRSVCSSIASLPRTIPDNSKYLSSEARVSNGGRSGGAMKKTQGGKSNKPCLTCAQQGEHTARRVDLMSRIIFPSVFLLFATGYWGYYLVQYQRGPPLPVPIAEKNFVATI